MLIMLNRKTLKPGSLILVIAAHVAREQPRHELTNAVRCAGSSTRWQTPNSVIRCCFRFAQQASARGFPKPAVPNPQNDLNVAQRLNDLNDLNAFQYMEFSARASNMRSIAYSIKSSLFAFPTLRSRRRLIKLGCFPRSRRPIQRSASIQQ
jgi:hypothetical protein